jgi:hypothetical protein
LPPCAPCARTGVLWSMSLPSNRVTRTAAGTRIARVLRLFISARATPQLI